LRPRSGGGFLMDDYGLAKQVGDALETHWPATVFEACEGRLAAVATWGVFPQTTALPTSRGG